MSRTSFRGALSRRDVLGLALTGLASVPALPVPVSTTADMTARELAAAMFMAPLFGTTLLDEEERWLRTLRPTGVILVQNNVGAPDEVRALVSSVHGTDAEQPPLVAVDQEGGLVSRIADDPALDAPSLGQLPVEEIARQARLRSEALAAYGFDVNFAPVADVAFAPDSAMLGRTFGGDPVLVAADVVAYLEGAAGTRVSHCLKHFPGHGRVATDSHTDLPVLDLDEATWWESDALPFRAGIDAGVPMVMIGHLVFPAWDELPASISPVAVHVLREDLGFTGVIVSDDLGMGALAAWDPLDIVDLAVAAGIDLLLYVVLPLPLETLVDHLAGRIERGEIARQRVADSVERIARLRPVT
ncbi:MAG: glycoside hydrolase family 3 N-terminal domain-containing protein [Thermomicrobiales bacterium]